MMAGWVGFTRPKIMGSNSFVGMKIRCFMAFGLSSRSCFSLSLVQECVDHSASNTTIKENIQRITQKPILRQSLELEFLKSMLHRIVRNYKKAKPYKL